LRKIVKKTLDNPNKFKENLLFWAQQFNEIVFLDSNRIENHNQPYPTYDFVLATDALTSIKSDTYNLFDNLKEYQKITNDWIFGSITYDAKNDIEKLNSNNQDGVNFPDLYFFQPKKLFFCKDDILEIHYLNFCDDELEDDFNEILTIQIKLNPVNSIKIQHKIDEIDYETAFNKILNHIQLGDIYEANFCQEFYANEVDIDPFSVFIKLNNLSKAPFSSFFKFKNHFVLSASPERYLKKINQKVISQPIKGTAKRNDNQEIDKQNYQNLAQSEKEKSENVMIVDMVRNDLSKTATKGSVKVEELCKIYPFKTVFQMISTVVSNVSEEISPVDVIKTTFPMASMTGVPKTRALQIIEEQETSKRGIYSGTIGYFSPQNDFDFNVVIRSILYNKENKYISFSTGSAITINSNAKDEYQECMAKAKAMFGVFD
jgi:para-aminobenzoate synthetase component I